jgi:hypothetical protein
VRDALERVRSEHAGDVAKLRRAGYRSPADFTEEITELLRCSGPELSERLLGMLFGGPDCSGSGRLGRLLV